MKKSKFITSSLLAGLALAIGGGFFMSSNTIEQSNNQVIIELSADLADMQQELTTLKSEAVSAEPFLGEVTIFSGNFAPRGWAFCHGQLLSIAQNTALFSLLGTTYGGDGRTTFGLPDLRGRSAIGQGTGPGLRNIQLGETSGHLQVTLTNSNMPNSSSRTQVAGFSLDPKSTKDTYIPGSTSFITVGNKSNTSIYTTPVKSSNGNQPFSVRNPYLGVNYIIAIDGIYPSRS